MSKLDVLVGAIEEKLNLTRRGFVKGVVALGAIASMSDFSKAEEAKTVLMGGSAATGLSDDPYSKETALNPTYRYGTSAHNCGGRCIIKAQVVNGRIVRFLTDENQLAYDGSSVEEGHRNSSQSRACARCRAYKTRLYHPGRLKYPLKQTKKRGDLSGFVRVSWAEALKDIAGRFNAVTAKYGQEAFHSIYACGNIYSPFQSGGYSGVLSVVSTDGKTSGATPAIKLLGGGTSFGADYSFHQYEFMGGYGIHYSGYDTGDGVMSSQISMVPSANDVAGVLNKIVLWGSNITSTVNPLANPWVKAIQEMKERNAKAKVIFIGPEFSDTAVTLADQWVQIKPYTDSALILGMMHHLLTTNKLDINYLDTMAYGFFDSPTYWIHNTNRNIVTADPKDTVNFTKVDAVPAGESLASYILGNGRLPRGMKALPDYGTTASNHIAKQFTGSRIAACSFSNKAGAGTIYGTKKDFQTPKTVDWASNITGAPKSTIIELAEFYADVMSDGKQIWNEWSGGQLKQAEGCNTLYMMQALNVVVGNWGVTGAGVKRGGIARSQTVDPNGLNPDKFKPASWSALTVTPNTPVPSVTMWHNAIKYAFGDQLKSNGYVPNIPDWKNEDVKTGNVYFDDGGIKALVKRKYSTSDGNAETFTDSGKTFFKWYATDGTLVDSLAGGANKTPLYSGFRFILNSSGNIPVNQHANSIDSTRMYEALPSHGYGAHQAKIADAFYLVTFDNFMAPAARYSDYVLPAKTTWEQADIKDLFWGNNLYIDEVIVGPGESKSTWDFARDLILACKGKESAKKFAPNLDSFKTHAVKIFTDKIATDNTSAFKGKSWDEFIKKPFTTNVAKLEKTKAATTSDFRTAFNTYKTAGYSEAAYTAFAKSVKIITRDAKTISFGGIGADQFSNPEECPNQSGRFHVYSGSLVWRYKNLFNQWHAHLPESQRGQNNKDREGDDIVYPIPMYFAYEDYFVDAYNLQNSSKLNNRFLLTTTHDRYRAHSSQAENPYLRELTHRIVGGSLYSGNDSGSYAISSNPKGDMDKFNNLNSLIDSNAKGTADASYSEILMNKSDAFAMKIIDGSLLEVSNEIGKVRVVARLSDRCVKGFVGLHQGCWFDPRTIDGEIVDVGGNCNTLMASRPSRYDHGNAQQSAMVNIRKII